jgi:hypothetical protein
VEELLARVTSRELTEWAAFEREYGPLGPERGDWQAAVVAHTVAMVNGAKNAKLSDFLPRWNGGRKQTAEEQLALFRGLASQGEPRVDDREPAHQDRGLN